MPAVKNRKIVINPVTRIEGHAKVTIHLDKKGKIEQARMHVVEFRGFERFIKGRMYWEAPVIVQRLCGICPVSHHLCAAKAMDVIVGADKLTPTGEKMRRLMHYGQTFQSHALHFFYLSAPDLLLGYDADPAIRNVIGIVLKHPELATQAILMRKYGQEVIKATAGKKIHGTGAIPGGINKNLSIEERDELKKDIDQMIEWSIQSIDICKKLIQQDIDRLSKLGTFESNYVSLVREDGALDLYDGLLRARDKDGKIIFDKVKPMDYLDYIREGVKNWSYMKFPFIKSIGQENGWYRVGPLARMNNCDFIDTPVAEEKRREFMELGGGKPVHMTMAYHWARLVELVHSAEKIKELLDDPDLQGEDLVTAGERRNEGVGILEAPRGTLFHHYRVNDNNQIEMANLIVSTTSNNEPMNRSVRRVAEDYLEGTEITEPLLNLVEVAIRAYDPCLSCATHAIGQMPLKVTLFDPDGKVLDEKARG
ncbi:MAG TPA: Ni/Fe hydrogenase subunit alpha [Spirochaetes bacterium]|nr:Ni/Fe hydrogenase subunit alpha [Spirochaetota bacterium]